LGPDILRLQPVYLQPHFFIGFPHTEQTFAFFFFAAFLVAMFNLL
jgi:hypothetical protein